MRAHGSMGPQEKQTNVISEEHASYTPYDMWDMLLEERGWAHMSFGGVGRSPYGANQLTFAPADLVHAPMHLP
jgi:hypothetical protein